MGTLRKQWERDAVRSKARAAELLQQAQDAENRLAAAEEAEEEMRGKLSLREESLRAAHTALAKAQNQVKGFKAAVEENRTSGADLEVSPSQRSQRSAQHTLTPTRPHSRRGYAASWRKW